MEYIPKIIQLRVRKKNFEVLIKIPYFATDKQAREVTLLLGDSFCQVNRSKAIYLNCKELTLQRNYLYSSTIR